MKKQMCHFTHVLEQKDFFSRFLKDIPNEKNALNHTDNSPCQKLATKIKAFQSAFEVKDSAANGTRRQVILLTEIDAIWSHITVCKEDSAQPACLQCLICVPTHTYVRIK